MKISIFGLGYVGCVSMACLAQKNNEMIGVDISETKVDQINSGQATIIEKDIDSIIKEQFFIGRIRATTDSFEAVHNSDLSIISVGTPSTANGHLNMDSMYGVAEDIGLALKEKESFHMIAIRSTVMPGTCETVGRLIEKKSGKAMDVDFAVLANPEFLREGTSVHDYFNPPITIIGASNSNAASELAKLYEELPAEIVITDLKIAEIMKFVNNTFHALKVSFANEVGNICQEIGIDSMAVMDILCKDKKMNLSPYYMKPGFAYGGSCLPKDLKAFQTLGHDSYVNMHLIGNIDKTNDYQISRCTQFVESFKKKKLGVLGLSFKAGTDDLRNSPAITVVEVLLGKGYTIKIYDRNVQLSRLTGTNEAFIDEHIPHLSKLMVSDAQELINASEVIVVTTKEQEFVDLLYKVNDKIIIDLVFLDEKLVEKENYFGINW